MLQVARVPDRVILPRTVDDRKTNHVSRTCSVQRSKWRSCDGDHGSRGQPIYETWRPYLAPLPSALRMRALGMWFALSHNLVRTVDWLS